MPGILRSTIELTALKIIQKNIFRITFSLLITLFAYLLYKVYIEVEQDTISQLNNQLKTQANLASEGIEQFIEALESDLEFLASIPSVKEASPGINRLMKDYFLTKSDKLKAITRIDSTGNIVSTYPYVASAIGRNVAYQPHNKFIIENHEAILSEVFEAVQGYNTIALAFPVFKDSVYTGCLSVLIPFDYIAKTFLSNIKVGKTGYAWMLSKKGIQIYCPIPDHTGKHIRQLAEYSEAAETILDLAAKQIPGFNIYYETNQEQTPQTTVKKYTYNEPILLPNTYWTIMVTAPDYEVLELMRGFRNNFLLIIIAFALSVGAFTLIYNKRKIKNAQSIREQQELYSKIGEETGLVFYDHHVKSGRIIWGGALSSTLGFTKEDLTNINIDEWRKLIHPADKDELLKSLTEAINKQSNFYAEYRFTKKNDEEIYLEDNGILLNPAIKDSERVVGVIKDISERKKIEKRLKRSKNELEHLVKERTIELNKKNKQLAKDLEARRKIEFELRKAKNAAEASDRLKSEFLAQMSHEIRTPISTITNFTSLLKMEFDENKSDDTNESFTSIENAANRLIRTVDLILNLSDIEAGTYTPRFQDLSLSKDIILPIINEFSVKASSKNLSLKFENLTENATLHLDRYTVTQIFANLIDNAIKYTNEGGVIIKLSGDEKYLQCCIIDTGIGISKEFVPEIFNVFTQEEQGYTRRYEGSGLGLALVKKYCEINDIDIWVSSEKRIGTTFGLELKKD